MGGPNAIHIQDDIRQFEKVWKMRICNKLNSRQENDKKIVEHVAEAKARE